MLVVAAEALGAQVAVVALGAVDGPLAEGRDEPEVAEFQRAVRRDQ